MVQIVKNIKDNIKKIINELSGTSTKEDRLKEIAEHDILPYLEESLINSDNMGKNPAEPMVSESSKNGEFSNRLRNNAVDSVEVVTERNEGERVVTERNKEKEII